MKHEIFAPFVGFYDSVLTSAVDNEVEMMAYNACEGTDIEQGEVQELIARHCDFRKVYLKAAQMWVKRFNEWVAAESDGNTELGLTFKELISPREYNFTTDRILCEIDTDVVFTLRCVSQMTLNEHCQQRHTSYSGFHSFYSNDWTTWPNDVLEWDCNQMQTLLEAWLLDNVQEAGKWIDGVLELMYEDWDDCLDAGMDWPAYEAGLAALAAK